MDLIESAAFNKGKKKLYSGVAGNSVAFACKLSFERGYAGVVSFIAANATPGSNASMFSPNCFLPD